MVFYGRDIARQALREIGVLDAIEAGTDELVANTLALGSLLLDTWRTKRLTIRAVTRTAYGLTVATQSYTIGAGGTLDQTMPESIPAWSVVPDDTATDPQELPMGEPFTWDQWQAIRVKSQTAPWPTRMWFDKAWTAHLGKLWFHPIPTGTNVGIVLYQRVAALTSLAAATQYDLEPGMSNALILNLALRACPSNKVPLSDVPDVAKMAAEALGDLKRSHSQLLESPMRSEFEIGGWGARRVFNIYTGGR